MPDRVAAVVLAAGESRRFGAPKQLALLGERTLLEHVLDTAATAGLSPVVAVVPVWLTRPAALDDPRLRWVRNPHPERGLSHSLQLAFAALPAEVEAAVILLGDQPTVTGAHLLALCAARGSQPIVATRQEGRTGPPLLLERSQFALVAETGGDAGLRRALAEHPELVLAVEPAEAFPDVDRPDDLAALD